MAALSAAAAPASAATLGCADDGAGTTDLSAWTSEMLVATNAHRATLGLVAVQLEPSLTRAAAWKSRDMARRNYFSHDDPASGSASGRTPWERLSECGTTAGGSKAENIAAGQRSGAEFIRAWLDSPGHRANIENSSMRFVGFGIASASSSTYGTYATQMFSSTGTAGTAPTPAPPSTPTVVIPDAPTLIQLLFDADAGTRLVCPPSSQAAGTRYVVDGVSGAVTVTELSSGCIDVGPRVGVAGTSATVRYHAESASGGRSSVVTLTVTVKEASRGLDEVDPVTGTEPSKLRSTLADTSSRVTRQRCSSSTAVAGWCWSIIVRGQLTARDGSALANEPITVSRRTSTGRYALLGRTTTDARGAFMLTQALTPPRRSATTWIRRYTGIVRISFAGSTQAHRTMRTIRTRT